MVENPSPFVCTTLASGVNLPGEQSLFLDSMPNNLSIEDMCLPGSPRPPTQLGVWIHAENKELDDIRRNDSWRVVDREPPPTPLCAVLTRAQTDHAARPKARAADDGPDEEELNVFETDLGSAV